MRARRFIPLALGLATLLLIGAAGAATAGGRPLSTELSFAQEVSATGVPDQGEPGATGHADLTFNPGQGEVCFHITVSGLTSQVTRAHIHQAAAGVNGPIVIDFFNLQPLGVPGNEFSDCVPASREKILELFHNQAGFYVNVHSVNKPGGAVRGQLGG
jgi:hypothetical protein